jgi:hypothetical protein
LKWGGILIFSVMLALGVITLDPGTIPQLTTNFRKNLIRSFEDSGMQTQLKIIDLSIWPPLIKWSFLKIARPTPPDLPNSWVQIFKTIELSDCAISVWPGWFDLQVDLHCTKIDIQHIPLQWSYVESLNSAYATEFFFTRSDFRNLESKQGWWNTTIKADNWYLNGKAQGKLYLSYHFISQTELEIEWPDSKEKILLSSEPEQLRIHKQGVGKNFSFLNPSLYTEIMPILRVAM